MFDKIARSFVLLCLAACSSPMPAGPEHWDIQVTDASQGLTSAGGDKLFALKVASAPKSYDLADVIVDVGLPGQTATAVNFTLTDANGNGKLDQGDSLVCSEPPINLFDGTAVGKTLNVHISEKAPGGTYYQRGSASWVPAK